MSLAPIFLTYALLHVGIWLLAPGAVEHAEAEQVLLSQTLALGYGKHPPLYAWLQHGVFQWLGVGVLGLAALTTASARAARSPRATIPRGGLDRRETRWQGSGGHAGRRRPRGPSRLSHLRGPGGRGTGRDSFALAIGHAETRNNRRVAVLDCLREIRPPVSPDAAVTEFAALLRAALTSPTGP